MKKLAILLAPTAIALAFAAGVATAHPLGNFTINRFSRSSRSGTRLYVLYVARHGRDPDLPGQIRGAGEGRGRLRRRSRPLDRPPRRRHRRRPTGDAHGGEHVLAFPPGQAGLRTTRLEVLLAAPPPRPRRAARVRRPQLRGPDRLEGDRRATWLRRHGGTLERALELGLPRAARLSRRTCSRARSTSPRRPRSSAGDRRRIAADAAAQERARAARRRPRGLRLRLRLADHARPSQCRRDPDLARGRALLGGGTRAQPRPRQVDRRGVPRRAARHAAARGPARR